MSTTQPTMAIDDNVIYQSRQLVIYTSKGQLVAAFKTGRDAKIKLRNAEITLDGDGDGKVEGE